jgi:endonuclease III related protein
LPTSAAAFFVFALSFVKAFRQITLINTCLNRSAPVIFLSLIVPFSSAKLHQSEIKRNMETVTCAKRIMTETKQAAIRAYFHTLFSAWGCQHWWPAQSRFEMIVGAYLTQNTSWTNVEKALTILRRARLLTIDGIRRIPQPKLAQLIRSSGYFHQKAGRLKNFVRFLDDRHDGSLARMFSRPIAEVRAELLALNGVGPETADSILLYAGNHPVFVVDGYTRRIFERHRIISSAASYDEIRELCEKALAAVVEEPVATQLESTHIEPCQRKSASAQFEGLKTRVKPLGSCHRPSRMSTARRSALVQVFNEMHGLVVGVGKTYCLKSQPKCEQCPLQKFLPLTK